MPTGVIAVKDFHGNPGTLTFEGITDAAKLKTFAQEFDNLTVAAIKGYRIVPDLLTDVSSTAIDGEYGYIKDRFICTFDVVKAANDPVETIVRTIPAPDATNIVKEAEQRVLDPTVGATLATNMKTATGWSSVTFTGSKFKSSIVKG